MMNEYRSEMLKSFKEVIDRYGTSDFYIEESKDLPGMGWESNLGKSWIVEEKISAKEKKRLAKEKERKREYQNKYQKTYRARKKLEKECHELMEEVKRLNKEYRNTYNRFDIMDIDE